MRFTCSVNMEYTKIIVISASLYDGKAGGTDEGDGKKKQRSKFQSALTSDNLNQNVSPLSQHTPTSYMHVYFAKVARPI